MWRTWDSNPSPRHRVPRSSSELAHRYPPLPHLGTRSVESTGAPGRTHEPRPLSMRSRRIHTARLHVDAPPLSSHAEERGQNKKPGDLALVSGPETKSPETSLWFPRMKQKARGPCDD